MKEMSGATALGMAALIGLGLSAPPAEAGYIVTLTQMGSNVVATGSGTIDLAALSFFSPQDPLAAQVDPANGEINIGFGAVFGAFDLYKGITGPTNFGNGGFTDAQTTSGDPVGISGSGKFLLGLPLLLALRGYVSGSPLSDSATFDNQTFATLDATPGTYVWKWGSGATADSFTLLIGTAPPPGVTVDTMPASCPFFTLVVVCTQYNYSFSDLLGNRGWCLYRSSIT